MRRFSLIRVPLAAEVIGRLADRAQLAGVSVANYASTLISSEVVGLSGGSAPTSTPKAVGRPVAPENEDLSSRIERNANISSGFCGVYPRSNRWVARWMYEELGRFSTPELAAIVRYWFEQGRRSVARDTLIGSGTPREEAVRLSKFLGEGAPIELPYTEPAVPPPCKHPKDRRSTRGGLARNEEVCLACGAVVRKRGRPPKISRLAALSEPEICQSCGQPEAGCTCYHDAMVSVLRGDEKGGSPDTTNDEPPEGIEPATGGRAPSTSEPSLGIFPSFRQPVEGDLP